MIGESDLILLDTNVLMFVVQGKENGRRLEETYKLSARPSRPLISVVTVGEVKLFPARRNWGPDKLRRLDELLSQLVVVDIRNRKVLENYVAISLFTETRGRKMSSDNDIWIAATAAAANATLLTSDGDFDFIAGKLIKRELFTPTSAKVE